jgi:hypothetical protein
VLRVVCSVVLCVVASGADLLEAAICVTCHIASRLLHLRHQVHMAKVSSQQHPPLDNAVDDLTTHTTVQRYLYVAWYLVLSLVSAFKFVN